MKKIITLLLLGLSSYAMAGTCETVDCMIEGFFPHMNAIRDLISTLAYVIGLGLVLKSILKFKEHNESKGQVKLTAALLYFVAGGILLGLPTAIKYGQGTVGVKSGNELQF